MENAFWKRGTVVLIKIFLILLVITLGCVEDYEYQYEKLEAFIYLETDDTDNVLDTVYEEEIDTDTYENPVKSNQKKENENNLVVNRTYSTDTDCVGKFCKQ